MDLGSVSRKPWKLFGPVKPLQNLEPCDYRAVLFTYSKDEGRFPSYKKFQAYTLLYGSENFPGKLFGPVKPLQNLEPCDYRAVLFTYSKDEGRFPSYKKFQAYTLLYGPENFPGLSRNGPLETKILIDFITVFDAFLTGRQSRQKSQCLYGNPMANNFSQT